MNDADTYEYQPKCSMPGCTRPAIYKVGATWSNGLVTELKNYGTCCADHRAELLEHARASRRRVQVAAGESLGGVSLYQLLPGVRDADLTRLPDEGL